MKTSRFRIFRGSFQFSVTVLITVLFPHTNIFGQPLMTALTFSNLTVGESYQMQQRFAWYWTNLPVNFTASSTVYSQTVSGAARSTDYRLAKIPVPNQAFAVAQIFNGSVTNAILTAGGSGYVTPPTVEFVRGGGTNATAIASISGSGAVTNIIITGGGTGYTNIPVIKISQPPAVAVSPSTQLFMRLIVPPFGWRLQFTPSLDAPWQDKGPITNTQTDVLITNDCGFFRLAHP